MNGYIRPAVVATYSDHGAVRRRSRVQPVPCCRVKKASGKWRQARGCSEAPSGRRVPSACGGEDLSSSTRLWRDPRRSRQTPHASGSPRLDKRGESQNLQRKRSIHPLGIVVMNFQRGSHVLASPA